MATASPIKPSYEAWSDLPDDVREAARVGIEPEDFADAVAIVAYGRFRVRVAIGLSVASAAAMYLNVYWSLVSFGDPAGYAVHGVSRLIALVIAIGLNIGIVVMSRLTRRLIQTGMARVMEETVDDAPAELSIAGRPYILAVIPGLAILAIMLHVGVPGLWVFECAFVGLGVALASIVSRWYFGPSRAADIDEHGIWLGRPGLHIPWTSIGAIAVQLTSAVIMVSGPVSPIDRAGWKWNGRRHSWPEQRTTVSIATTYPEMVKWVARAYTDVAETDGAVLARGVPIRRRSAVRRTVRRYIDR